MPLSTVDTERTDLWDAQEGTGHLCAAQKQGQDPVLPTSGALRNQWLTR